MGQTKLPIEIHTNLIEDFQTYIQYFETNRVKLTKNQEYVTKKHLLALYAEMSEPKLEVPSTKTQEGYPLLHLFFHIGIQLKLLKKERLPGGVFISVVPKKVDMFRNYTAIEQYFILLQSFWEKVDWTVFESRYSFRAPENIDYLFEEFRKYPANKKINIRAKHNLKQDLYQYDHFLLYFSYFGLWEVELDVDDTNKYARNHLQASSLTLTPLFKKIEKALEKNWMEHLENNDHSENVFDSFLSLFGGAPPKSKRKKTTKKAIKPLITLIGRNFPTLDVEKLLLFTEEKFVSGIYTLKVSLSKSCSRTVQLYSDHTLLELHELIQESFEFDDDHLYSFYMDGKKFSQQCFHSPGETVGPFVNEAKIGDLQLMEGQRFLYLFDFVDEWEFNIEVVQIQEGAPYTEPTVIDKTGEAPLQYGEF